MRVFLRTYKDGEFTEKIMVNTEATLKAGEKKHICFHDEKIVRPCRLEGEDKE